MNVSDTFRKFYLARRFGIDTEGAVDSMNELQDKYMESPGSVVAQNRGEAQTTSALKSKPLKMGQLRRRR